MRSFTIKCIVKARLSLLKYKRKVDCQKTTAFAPFACMFLTTIFRISDYNLKLLSTLSLHSNVDKRTPLNAYNGRTNCEYSVYPLLIV